MHEAISKMLAQYECRRLDDHVHALREILQEVALLGLWRAKFFEKAAFYGGTALRILYGLDRFSEDMDFSLLTPMADFDLGKYMSSLQKEIEAFGFDVWIEKRNKAILSPIQSAFLKADTHSQLLVIDAGQEIVRQLPKGQLLRIRLEVDTDPPSGFTTHTRYLLQPIPFAVRAFVLPDLFAGKMHAVLCRRWKTRVKGRDWYDLVWYVTNHPDLNLYHLEQRMRQTGDWRGKTPLTSDRFRILMEEAIKKMDVDQARREVIPFVPNADAMAVWSRDFFRDVASRIRFIEG